MMRIAAFEQSIFAARLTFGLASLAFILGTAPLHADVTGAEGKGGLLKRLNPFGGKDAAPTPSRVNSTPTPAPVVVAQTKKPSQPSMPGPRPKVTTIKPKSGNSSSKKSASSSSSSKGGTKKKTAVASSSAPKKTTKQQPAEKVAVAKKESTEPAADKKAEETKPEEAKKNQEGTSESMTANATPDVKPSEIEKVATDVTNKKTTTSSKEDGEFSHSDEDAKDEAGSSSAVAKKPAGSEPAVKSTPPPPSTPLPASRNGGWQIVKIDGRDFVTGESIHQFYRFSSYKVEGKHVWLRSNNLIMKGQIGSRDMLINNIKFILSYPIMESGGRALFSRLDLCKLIDPVLRPTYITDAEPFDTVVIDAGHGGHDAGARGIYGYEKDFALKMAFTVRDALIRRGFKVVLTRSTDEFISLRGRVAIANRTPNSIFISLHFNAGGSAAASGIETFALTPQGSSASLERGGGYNAYGLTGNSHDSANIALATAVHAMVISKFKFVDRGIKRAQWSVLTGCRRPGILFEGGFVTNPNECRLIASDTYRQSVSSAIADAVSNYRTALRGVMTKRR